MSHQFKYEINEINLRLQLKGHEITFNDEAWKRFESFSNSQKTNVSNDVMKRFSVKLNRNVVLPIVFGSVIILFSFLLFNFINIKNPNTESSAKIETKQNEIAPKPVLNKKTTNREPAIQIVSELKDSASILNIDTKQIIAQAPEIIPNTQDVAKNTQPIYKDNYDMEHSANRIIAKSDSGKNNIGLNNATQQEDSTPKKKNKKSVVVITETEPTEEEANQTPPPVSQAVSPSEIEGQN